jgi:peptidoglycan hydrolase FlgJ
MPKCGVLRIFGVPDSELDGLIQTTELDKPDEVHQEKQADGTWVVTLVFPRCADNTDPLQVQSFGADQTVTVGKASGTPDAFIQSHLPTARTIKQKYRVPISVMLSQSALETGWGRSVVGNAYFGIKADHGQSSVTTLGHEVQGGVSVLQTIQLRRYANFDEAADDYGRFLTTNPRYAPAFVHTDNPEAFALAVAAAGFATSPNYGSTLVDIIRSHNLEDFDRV